MACKSDPPADQSDPVANETKTFQVYEKKTPHWAKSTTLVRVDLSDPTASLASITKNLEEWQRLGITSLILAPVYALDEKGLVVDFTKVDPNVGTFAEFQEFTRAVRRLRMRTILEWKLPEVSVDHVWRSSNPDWFSSENQQHIKLDLSQSNLRSTMIESMKFWLRSADIDGFSCLNTEQVPLTFWQELRPGLESIRPVLMLADSDDVVEHHESCFEATKAAAFDDLMAEVMDEKKSVEEFQAFYARELANNPSTYFKYHTISPEPGNTDRAKLKMSLAFLMEGAPVLQSQEALAEDPKFFQHLIMLRNYNRGLGHGSSGGRMKFVLDHPRVLAFSRSHEGQTVTVVANCSAQEQRFKLEESLRTMSDLFSGKEVHLLRDQEVTLKPWQIHILANPSIQL